MANKLPRDLSDSDITKEINEIVDLLSFEKKKDQPAPKIIKGQSQASADKIDINNVDMKQLYKDNPDAYHALRAEKRKQGKFKIGGN